MMCGRETGRRDPAWFVARPPRALNSLTRRHDALWQASRPSRAIASHNESVTGRLTLRAAASALVAGQSTIACGVSLTTFSRTSSTTPITCCRTEPTPHGSAFADPDRWRPPELAGDVVI